MTATNSTLPQGGASDRTHLKAYAEAISMWCARFDTKEIADRLGIPEAMACAWIANFRDVVRAEP